MNDFKLNKISNWFNISSKISKDITKPFENWFRAKPNKPYTSRTWAKPSRPSPNEQNFARLSLKNKEFTMLFLMNEKSENLK